MPLSEILYREWEIGMLYIQPIISNLYYLFQNNLFSMWFNMMQNNKSKIISILSQYTITI